MTCEIKFIITVSNPDVAGACYVQLAAKDEPPRDLGTLTPWQGSDDGVLQFWGHPIGGPHRPWISALDSELYDSVEAFVTAVKNVLLPN